MFVLGQTAEKNRDGPSLSAIQIELSIVVHAIKKNGVDLLCLEVIEDGLRRHLECFFVANAGIVEALLRQTA